ncbi:MAG: hypothetical protein HJJLKODD_03004 [Phycisphaerae bacterium]|nr:hypothetical protein [Phycisphaerae bacterium]
MVTATELLNDLQRRGVRFSVHCGKLRADAPVGVLTPEVKTAIGHLKPQMITILTPNQPINHPDQLPERWRELYEERAAIREFDGGQAREHAETEALKEILILMESKK